MHTLSVQNPRTLFLICSPGLFGLFEQSDKGRIALNVKRVPWCAGLGLAETHQRHSMTSKNLRHIICPLPYADIRTPRRNHWSIGRRRRILEKSLITNSRDPMSKHIVWIGRPECEQVFHAQRTAALPARKANATANCRVVLIRVCRRRVEHNEGACRAIIPLTRQPVPKAPAIGDHGIRYREEV